MRIRRADRSPDDDGQDQYLRKIRLALWNWGLFSLHGTVEANGSDIPIDGCVFYCLLSTAPEIKDRGVH